MTTKDVPCTIQGCEYSTGDTEPIIAASLLQIHAITHSKQTSITKPKITPPEIPMGCTTETFKYLKSRWESYKTMTELPENQHAQYLLNSCEVDLRRALYRVHQDNLSTLSEKELLSAIETLAVRIE